MQDNHKRVLFIGESFCLAHVVRPLVLACGLRESRPELDIQFACGRAYKHIPEKQGFSVHSLPTITAKDFFGRLKAGKPGYDLATLSAYVDAETRLLRELNPDLVVGDNRFSLAISCNLQQIPYTNLVNAHWSPWYTLGFPVPDLPISRFCGNQLSRLIMPLALPFSLRSQAEPFNQLSRHHGLPAMGNLKDVFTSGDYVLYADTPGLSPARGTPSHHSYLGPVLWEPDGPLPVPAQRSCPGQKQVYVTMGSSGDTTVVSDSVAACRSLGYRVVVSADAQQDIWKGDSGITTAPLLPGIQVMKHCDLMICQGGSGTVYQALTNGVPVLGICANPDQQLVMQGVENAGAGVSMLVREASRKKITVEIQTVMELDTFCESAKTLRDEIRFFDAPARFNTIVNMLLSHISTHSAPEEMEDAEAA